MNPTIIKRIVIAFALVVLSYLLFMKEPQAPQIITTIKELPSPTAEVKPSPVPVTSPKPAIETPASQTPDAATKQVSSTKSIVDTINANDLKVQYLNPEAPCPAKQQSCYALPGGMTIDASCPTYKPVWAYISLDNGLTWSQVGCYATEFDAEKAIKKAEQTGSVQLNSNQLVTGKLKSPEKPLAQVEPPHNNLGTIQETPDTKPTEPKMAEKPVEPAPLPAPVAVSAPEKSTSTAIEKKAEKPADVKPVTEKPKDLSPDELKTTEHKTNSEKAKPAKLDKPKPTEDLTVNFKTAFGLVSVEKRTYPNLEMKQKAISMWDNGQRLLEPDGSINEKYMVKPKDSVLLPGNQ